MSNTEHEGRECPNCGRVTAAGEVQCDRCGEPLAVGPLGGQSPTGLLWAGRVAAVAGFVAPLAGLVALLLSVSLWTVYGRERDAAQTIAAALVFGAIGYIANGGFVLI